MGILILIILGVILLLRGGWMLGGGDRSWYLSRSIYSGGIAYAQIPIGMFFISLAVAAITQLEVFANISIGLGICGFIFSFLQPSFLKPTWLKWLEQGHGDIMPILQQEANAMGLGIWEARVKTQADLETWVAEVRRKHGLEEH